MQPRRLARKVIEVVTVGMPQSNGATLALGMERDGVNREDVAADDDLHVELACKSTDLERGGPGVLGDDVLEVFVEAIQASAVRGLSVPLNGVLLGMLFHVGSSNGTKLQGKLVDRWVQLGQSTGNTVEEAGAVDWHRMPGHAIRDGPDKDLLLLAIRLVGLVCRITRTGHSASLSIR